MRAAVSLLGIAIALAITYYLITAQWSPKENSPVQPRRQIDITGVQSDLLTIGQAERLYLTTHASYGTVDQLQQDGALSFTGSSRRGYVYSAQVDGGAHFTVTATPSDPAKSGWPTLTIDENLEVSTK
jgi:hypothetical protein